ncbi:probable assembly chaperone of rpl4 [Paramuricea clavata]|uniref:Probable assembly chaperone of rpl4 n=1 Tax=Paramuricea clavata TaxID=317549 RepID=A0A6S7GFP0_PARCT|nr:probable assembly chaperone of rpl4 [Paramuricea clavata]
MPSYESRISLSKMLIEVEEFDNACTVLEELLSEDDEVVQVWYLLGWIQYLKEQDFHVAVYYLEMAQKNAYKEAVTQNFSVISYIWPELYDDEVRILAAAIKIRHIGKFKCSGVFDVIVSTHSGVQHKNIYATIVKLDHAFVRSSRCVVRTRLQQYF